MRKSAVKEIPQGYKNSPLGIIPNEWEVKRLGEISQMFSGGTPKSTEQMYFNGEIPFIKSGEISNAKTEQYLSELGLKNSSAKLIERGDLLYALYGATSGECALSKISGAINQAILCIRPTKDVDRYFLLSFLQKGKEYYYNSYLQGGQGNLSADIVKGYKILTPPLPEQRKIAEVLSTWDRAIEKQTLLVEKLELRKKGLMQQLLTGKKRLPGFSEEWKKVKLGDIAKRIVRKNNIECSNVVTISAQKGFVRQTDFFNKKIASETVENYYLVKRDEFCYNKSYCNGFPMGAIKRLKEFDQAVVTTLYICFSIQPERASLDFIEQYFSLGLLNRGLMKIANEGGRAHGLLNVTPNDFFNTELMLPPFDEQKAISSILLNAHEEVIFAKSKLEFLRKEKKGLMQVLLTGKKRVRL